MGKEGKKGAKSKAKIEYLIVKRIDAKLEEKGMSRHKLVTKVRGAKGGFGKTNINNWEERETIPRADIALFIADILECSVRWLITGINDKQDDYTPAERNLVKKYRDLDEQGKRYVDALLSATPAAANEEVEAIAAVEKKHAAG
jgi:transcriptional regulator with XRE-family HTH domain